MRWSGNRTVSTCSSELCSRQAEEQESLYLEIRRLRHDMKNYLSCLLGAVQNGEKKEAEMLIQGMLNNGISNKVSEVSRSGNIVVDSLVNYKHDLAEKKGLCLKLTYSFLYPCHSKADILQLFWGICWTMLWRHAGEYRKDSGT